MFINNFDPVALEILSLEIRWYSLAYIMGILIGWFLAKKFLIGIIIASILFAKKNNDDVFEYLDVIALVAPIGIFFGRLANFINSELYGYETNMPWGVKFIQVDDLYRHPTQLYEAFFEGFVLFFVLLFFRKKERFKIAGILSSLFLLFSKINVQKKT